MRRGARSGAAAQRSATAGTRVPTTAPAAAVPVRRADARSRAVRADPADARAAARLPRCFRPSFCRSPSTHSACSRSASSTTRSRLEARRAPARQPPRGWRGHGAAVLRGELSTGALKAVGSLGLALLAMSYLGAVERALAARRRGARARHERLQPARPAPGARDQGVRAARRRPRDRLGRPAARCGRSGCSSAPALVAGVYDLRERAMLGDTGANLLGALAGLWLVLTLSGTGQLWRSRCSPRSRSTASCARSRPDRTDAGAAPTRLLGQALMTLHYSDRHAQAAKQDPVHLRDRRRRLLARQGHRRRPRSGGCWSRAASPSACRSSTRTSTSTPARCRPTSTARCS